MLGDVEVVAEVVVVAVVDRAVVVVVVAAVADVVVAVAVIDSWNFRIARVLNELVQTTAHGCGYRLSRTFFV